MDAELERQVAASLDTTPELLPYLPELLADLEALGCAPRSVIRLLRAVGLPPRTTRLLDLGCGKGAIALAAARELAYSVTGVDGFQPFIDSARKRATELCVAGLCDFRCDDLRRVAHSARGDDVVVYASHGPMLMDAPCVETLRRCVRPGGYMVVDDGFLAQGAREPLPPGYEDYLPYEATLARMTAHGDEIVGEEVFSAGARDVENQEINVKIRRRAEALAARHPDASALIFDYVENQERECEILREIHVPAVWILRRA